MFGVLAVMLPASQVLQKLNRVHPSLQGPPGLKGEQGDTVVIDYDGRILDALKVSTAAGRADSCRVMGREGAERLLSTACPCATSPS